ncbi:MAG: ABC transporter ATP-binding protein [Anaerolineaceae bacterium]|nr:ABC transporter ATP-binding protein [Anaerolineaceae bacterium]
MSFLEVTNVVAGYGSGPDILKGVNLQVQSGQVQCIIGPNGAGKSTLLKVISGLLHPRNGQIHYQGQRIDQLRPDQILAKGICFVPQERSLFPDMSVRENLKMGGYVLSDRHTIDQRINEVFELFPILGEKRHHAAKTLSGGQQQMLAMGRTLVLRPAIVLLDEPSLGLAPIIVEQIFEIVQIFRQNGMTVLIVEQNARKGLEIADWGCVLDLGQNRFDGPANQILDDPRIRELYLGTHKDTAQ